MNNDKERAYQQACRRLQSLLDRGADSYEVAQAEAEVSRLSRALKKSAKKPHGKGLDNRRGRW